MEKILEALLESEEPSVQFKVRVGVLGEDCNSPTIRTLRQSIKKSPRVERLLSSQKRDGQIEPIGHEYRKWTGAHWILATLADIGYPLSDPCLAPAIDQVLNCWLNPKFSRDRACEKERQARSIPGVPIINGRARRCASQQGNALFSAIALGFMNDRVHQLAECLMRWQWPDGGWNCDRRPEAVHSSFWESLIPLRGMAHYARYTGDAKAKEATERASEVFLRRHLYQRQRDRKIMNAQFIRLHYPCYWKYDILFSLKVMAEAGFISDSRCRPALDLLESKRLPDGGWPAEERLYHCSERAKTAREIVKWGPISRKQMNPWVTSDALAVLRAAGRLAPTN